MALTTAPIRVVEDKADERELLTRLSGQIAPEVIRFFQVKPQAAGAAQLTGTEQQVLGSLARGFRSADMAEHLGVALSTVRTHIWRIYRKLQVHNRTDAIRAARPPLPG